MDVDSGKIPKFVVGNILYFLSRQQFNILLRPENSVIFDISRKLIQDSFHKFLWASGAFRFPSERRCPIRYIRNLDVLTVVWENHLHCRL